MFLFEPIIVFSRSGAFDLHLQLLLAQVHVGLLTALELRPQFGLRLPGRDELRGLFGG